MFSGTQGPCSGILILCVCVYCVCVYIVCVYIVCVCACVLVVLRKNVEKSINQTFLQLTNGVVTPPYYMNDINNNNHHNNNVIRLLQLFVPGETVNV